MDTAGGLPTKHNPECILENNPHYTLRIHRCAEPIGDHFLVAHVRLTTRKFPPNANRPTELRIMLSQTDSRGIAQTNIHPIAFFVVRPNVPGRRNRVNVSMVLVGKATSCGGLTVALLMQELSNDNVVASSGLPRVERTVDCFTSLQPGLYIILCTAYIAGLEGPFTLSVTSNHPGKRDGCHPQ